MRLLDITLSRPEENIVFDEVLLFLAEKRGAGEVLRFWESKIPFIVLGKTSNALEDVFLEKVNQDNIPLLRRASAGGTVLQSKGCLNFTLILSKEKNPQIQSILSSYQFILGRIIHALQSLHITAEFLPISDIAIDNKKISGNAQKRGRHFILHHGTLLYDFDIALAQKYLKIPKKFPSYRKKREHENFLVNIPAGSLEIKNAIMSQFPISAEQQCISSDDEKVFRGFLLDKTYLA